MRLSKMRPQSLGDDMRWKGFKEALQENLRALKKRPDTTMDFGPVQVDRKDYVNALEYLSLAADQGEERLTAEILSNFDFFEIYGRKKWGEVFMTSYFEPVIEGSRKRTNRFSQALYSLPEDMVIIDLAAFSEAFPNREGLKKEVLGSHARDTLVRARFVSKSEGGSNVPRILPYFSRQEIDEESKLKGKRLELAWVDPIDAFFLHIQGSGTVRFADGKELRVGYAGQNGHSYVAVGKFLKDAIPLEEMSLQRIEQHLRSLSKEDIRYFLNQNPSYIFFRKLDGRPKTSFDTEVVNGRVIATDPKYFPKGGLAFLEFEKPLFESPQSSAPRAWEKAHRFVFDQDTGGAIRGPARLDLFWGRGEKAKQAAGVMKRMGRLHYLVPKPGFLSKLRQSKSVLESSR